MKNYLLLLFLLLSGTQVNANEAKQALKKGHYAKAFNVAYSKVQQKTWRTSFTHILEEAYAKANRQEHLEIQNLYLSNNESDAERIYQLFSSIKRRQDLVKLLGDVKHKKTNTSLVFAMIPCEDAIVIYKNKTVAYNYSLGTDLLANGNRLDARRAFTHFEKVIKLQADYEKAQALLAIAKQNGMTHVFIQTHNNSNAIIPHHIQDRLLLLNNAEINKAWIQYSTTFQSNMQYDYTIDLSIENIDITGDNMDSKFYTQTKEVEDGFEYKKDPKGNYIVDSLGKKIKEKKFITLTARIKEYKQSKRAKIQAMVYITDNQLKLVVQQLPIAYEYIWQNDFVEFKGDRDALCGDALTLSSHNFIPFPTSDVMIHFTDLGLKQNFKAALNQSTTSIQ